MEALLEHVCCCDVLTVRIWFQFQDLGGGREIKSTQSSHIEGDVSKFAKPVVINQVKGVLVTNTGISYFNQFLDLQLFKLHIPRVKKTWKHGKQVSRTDVCFQVPSDQTRM